MALTRKATIWISSLILTASVTIAHACAALYWLDTPVEFGEQRNIIIWNSKTKTQHFIRDARFKTIAPDFGFIALSPTVPELVEADPAIFDMLDLAEPARAETYSAAAGEEPELEIVQVKDVGGYRATTLKATDSKALVAWLEENKYVPSEETKKWVQHYVEKNWYLTAFKVLNSEEVASTGTVRMTFKADEPFNPYYVPNDNIPSKHSPGLLLYFISDKVYEGKIGGKENWLDPHWTGNANSHLRASIARAADIPESELPEKLIVSKFLDGTFPRKNSADLVFSPALIQPGGSNVFIRIGSGILALGVIALWWATRRNQQKFIPAESSDESTQ